MFRYPILTACSVAILVSGCASVHAPSQLTHLSANQPVSPAAIDAGMASGVPARQWWRALNDPVLDTLVQDAMANNHDIVAALAGVRSARALADAAQRDARPQGRLEGQVQKQRPSMLDVDPFNEGLPRAPERNVMQLGQGLSWEIDLFGRIGTASGVAARRADAAHADWHAAVALIQMEVVRQYAGLRQQQQIVQSLVEEVTVLSERSRHLTARVDAGLIDRAVLLAAQGDEARAVSEQAQARAMLERHLDALAVLTGRSPAERGAWAGSLASSDAITLTLPAQDGLVRPSDLLARRPDVLRADANLRAAIGETVLADRAHLPRLSLNLNAGLGAPFGSLGNSAAFSYAAGPSLSWDWLDAGRHRARVAAAQAGQEAAWHGFERTVLQALQESEGALRQWTAALTVLAQAQRAEKLTQDVAMRAKARVGASLDPRASALEWAAAHQRARRSAVIAHADAIQAYSQLQLALGAWQPDASL
ncbi:TolC family protein [Burkholderiaceae bacterium DAT-1]|nr:TolC family protein [Burkholderiaceae bacterium DAT-1]